MTIFLSQLTCRKFSYCNSTWLPAGIMAYGRLPTVIITNVYPPRIRWSRPVFHGRVIQTCIHRSSSFAYLDAATRLCTAYCAYSIAGDGSLGNNLIVSPAEFV